MLKLHWQFKYNHKRDIDKNILVINPIIISLFIIYIIFILFNKNKKIINYYGLNKILLFSFGVISIYISLFFISYSNPLTCLLKYLFKHFGISTILMMQIIDTLLGYFLGISIQSNGNESTTNNLFVESINYINQMENFNKNNKMIIKDKRSSVLNDYENNLFTQKDNRNNNNNKELPISVNYINGRKESNIDMESLNIAYGKKGKQVLIKKIKVIYHSILEIVFIYIILNIAYLLF